MGWFQQGITKGNVELLVVHVVQEHVDACEVVGGQVDLLAVEPTHVFLAENLRKLQKQRAGTGGRIVDLVYALLSPGGDVRQELGDFLRRLVLTAGLACAGGIHLHEVFVGVSEKIDRVLRELTAQR